MPQFDIKFSKISNYSIGIGKNHKDEKIEILINISVSCVKALLIWLLWANQTVKGIKRVPLVNSPGAFQKTISLSTAQCAPP